MRKAAVVVLSVLALVLGTTSLAGAAKPAYQVSLRTSVSSSTADHFITVSGKVVGPKAIGKTVTIQRKYVGGSWVTVATALVRSHGNYSARVETPHGGTTSFRAIKGRSSLRSAGVSPTRSIPVYKWLYLAAQPVLQGGSYTPGVDTTVAGKHYTHAIVVSSSNGFSYKPGKLCTTLRTDAVYVDNSSPSVASSIDFNIAKYDGVSAPDTVTTHLNAGDAPTTIGTSIAGQKFLTLSATGYTGGYTLYLGDPKVYCNADSLPSWTNSDFA